MKLKRNEQGSHHILLLMAVVVAVAIGLVGYKVFNSQGTRKSLKSAGVASDAFTKEYANGCKDRQVSFTSPPMSFANLGYIRPLGAVSDGHVTPTDHVYVIPKNSQVADNTYPVLMPAGGTVTRVDEMPAEYIGDRKDVQVAAEDHRVIVSFSCRYFAIFIHVHKLGPALHDVVGKLDPNASKSVSVELKAGEVIGYIGGAGYDWVPIDAAKNLPGFITPSLYESEPWKIHTVDPFSLYTGALKKKLEATSLRSVAPIGGKIDYDQAGKLIGNWFRQGTGGYDGNSKNGGGRYWDGHLSVAPDYIDPNYTIVSIGNWDGNAAQFVVKDTSVNPAEVSANSGVVKYQLIRLGYGLSNGQQWDGASPPTRALRPSLQGEILGTIAFQVLDGEKLKVEKFPGKTPAQVSGFTSAAQTYER